MKSTKPHPEGLQRSARTRWIAVGDASRFIIFEKDKSKALSALKTFTNEAAHQKISDLTTSQPGRSFESSSRSTGGHQTGAPRHAYSSEQDPKTHAVENFLRNVSDFLNQGHHEHSFENLVLITNDRLLGKLRSFLAESTQASVSEEHPKDLAWLSGPELESRVNSLLTLDG